MRTAPGYAQYDLDADLFFDRALVAGDIDVIHAILAESAAGWSARSRVWHSNRDQRVVDIGQNGSLYAAVRSAASERGHVFKALVATEMVPGEPDPNFGSVELRGSGQELTILIAVDQEPTRRLGKRTLLGNQISIQVRGPLVEGENGWTWLENLFRRMCAATSPVYALACQSDQ